MAPLASTLALLAMTVVTAAITELPLDMAKDSFDDQYQGCVPNMTAALPALNQSEFQLNKNFALAWVKATDKLNKQPFTFSDPLPHEAIALMAYATADMRKQFNEAVLKAGSSPQEYRDNFHFKTLHFLLTQALVMLRSAQGQKCYDLCWGLSNVQVKTQRGDIVRFGRFTSMLPLEKHHPCFKEDIAFQVYTCHGADLEEFSYNPAQKEVLIPPFETFEVTEVTKKGSKTQISLRSTGTFSKYNCEWLGGDVTGGSGPRTTFHLGGLLLATTTLAVATGIL